MRSDTTSNYKKRDVEHDSSLVLARDTIRTGVSTSGNERNHLFMNVAGQDFVELSGLSGLDSTADGRSFAWLDYDADGRLDIALVNANAPLLELFHNELQVQNGFLSLELVGGNHQAAPSSEWSARDGIGSKITVVLDQQRLVREVSAGAGLGAQNSGRIHIGIGAHAVADSVTVRWPSGRVTTEHDVPAARRVVLYENPLQSPSGESMVLRPYRIDPQVAVVPQTSGSVLPVQTLPPRDLQVFITTATWCGGCKAAQPHIQRLAAHFEGSVGFYAVPTDEPQAVLNAYWRKHRPAWT